MSSQSKNFGSYYQSAPQSRAEMDLQLRDLEYKIGAGDRKN